MPNRRIGEVSAALFAAVFLSTTAYAQGSSSEPAAKVAAETALFENSSEPDANVGAQISVPTFGR